VESREQNSSGHGQSNAERFQFALTLECTGKNYHHPDMRSDRFKPFVVINGKTYSWKEPDERIMINDGFRIPRLDDII
jgi:hypothetical protein